MTIENKLSNRKKDLQKQKFKKEVHNLANRPESRQKTDQKGAS